MLWNQSVTALPQRPAMPIVQLFFRHNRHAVNMLIFRFCQCGNDCWNRYLCGVVKKHSAVSTQHSAPHQAKELTAKDAKETTPKAFASVASFAVKKNVLVLRGKLRG